MKPIFSKDGLVTVGNASGLNDGAAALVLAEAGKAAALGLKPLARLVAYSHAGVDPAYMGIGPVPATRLVLQRAGLKLDAMDVDEANKAFAATAGADNKELRLDPPQGNTHSADT